MTVSDLLYYLVAFDALLVLVLGVVVATMYMLGTKFDVFWERIVPATATLVGTSLGAGLILWIGTQLFA